MSTESREFVQMRNDIYAAERSKCAPEVVIEPEHQFDCRFCGRPVTRPFMHCCTECFTGEEA